MSNIITAVPLYENDDFLGLCVGKKVSLNSNNFTGDTPKFAWLNRVASPIGDVNGIAYALTFANPNADALKGVWIETTDGDAVLIDADPTTGVADVIEASNACCGESTDVPTEYNGTFPALTGNVVHNGTITRADNGSFLAKQKLTLDDYGDRVITISFASRNSGTGVSTYNWTAYEKPIPVKFNGNLDTVVQSA